MSIPIDVVAILSPQKGKEARLVELFTKLQSDVKAHEKGCMRYLLHRQISSPSNVDEFVMIERYGNQDAVDNHFKTEHFAAFRKILGEEKLLNKAPVVFNLTVVTGFEV